MLENSINYPNTAVDISYGSDEFGFMVKPEHEIRIFPVDYIDKPKCILRLSF